MDNESSLSGSLSPLRSDEKIHSRYLSPHMASCHDFCKHGKKHEVESEGNRLNFRKFMKKKKKLAQVAEKNQTMISDNTKYLDHTEVRVSRATNHNENIGTKSFDSDDEKSELIITKSKTKSSIKTTVSTITPKVMPLNLPNSTLEPEKNKQKVIPPLKKVNGDGKTSITLKTKMPLIRSLSKNKSLRNLSLRKNHENKMKRNLMTSSEVGENESKTLNVQRNQNDKRNKSLTASKNGEKIIVKSTPISSSSKKPQDNASSSLLRKAKSIKRTSSSHGSVLSVQLRKVRSIKKTATPNESVSSFPLKKVKSSKKNVSTQEKISSLQLRKVKSIKTNSVPHENVSSPGLRKIKSIKKNSLPQYGDSSSQLRRIMSIKRTSTTHESDSSWQQMKLNSITENSSSHESDPLQLMKLKSIKKNSSHHESISNMLSRKFMSIMRSSSVKHKNKIVKPDAESNTEKTDLGSISKSEESKCVINGACNEKKRLPRSANARVEENMTAPSKLKFRRGTVLNLRSNSINGAKRLWFNIGKLANNENTVGNGLLRKRSIRKKRGSFGSKDFEIHSIVLKHQDVAEKKDAKSLFNDVIEETASKLVETRKSKVKALVGAFETVISLQESKPVSVV